MARINLGEIKKRAGEINSGWTQDPTAKAIEFMSISQTEYQAKIDSCEADDAEIAVLEAQLKDKKDGRDDNYRGLNQMSVKVRDGVQGNADYGDDSPLYGAMGFKRKSERASGLTRKKKEPQ